MNRKLLLTIAALLCLACWAKDAHAAARYWVGGGLNANWDVTGPTNWSTTSGGPNNAAVPTTADTVYFDQNSTTTLTNGTTCYIPDASCICGSLNCTGYAGTLNFGSGGAILTVTNGDSGAVIKFPSGTGGACVGTGQLIISGAVTITPNNTTVFPGSVNFACAGNVTLGANFTVAGLTTF